MTSNDMRNNTQGSMKRYMAPLVKMLGINFKINHFFIILTITIYYALFIFSAKLTFFKLTTTNKKSFVKKQTRFLGLWLLV